MVIFTEVLFLCSNHETCKNPLKTFKTSIEGILIAFTVFSVNQSETGGAVNSIQPILFHSCLEHAFLFFFSDKSTICTPIAQDIHTYYCCS